MHAEYVAVNSGHNYEVPFQICMPWCRDNTPTQTLLGTLTRGVILQEEDGDVFATRLCQCAVFFGDKRGVLTKLERYDSAFCPAITF